MMKTTKENNPEKISIHTAGNGDDSTQNLMTKVGQFMNPACALVQNIPRLRKTTPMMTSSLLLIFVLFQSFRNAFTMLFPVLSVKALLNKTSSVLSGSKPKNIHCMCLTRRQHSEQFKNCSRSRISRNTGNCS